MLQFSGIGLTDEINLYNEKFTLAAMYSAYDNIWNEGVPSYINHDHRKHVGWTKLSGIYLEPQKAYTTNTMYVGENETEKKALQTKSYDFLYRNRVIERKEQYEDLVERLGSSLSSKYQYCWVNGVSVYDKNIVERVLPNLCKKKEKGLIPLKELNSVLPGIYEMDGYLIFAHEFFRRGFSRLNTLNEPFLDLLEKCKDTHDVKISIDMDCIGLLGTQGRELEYQYWWGPKFNDDLSNIPLGVTVYENEHYDGLLSDVLRTEFGWYIQDNIQTFECEEITDMPNIENDNTDFYGCRFVHSMVNEHTKLPYHLDGAVRAYSEEKMIDRLDVNIKNTERDTLYTKIWRIDGNIDIVLWKKLITHYYRDNTLVGEYFGGVDKKIDVRHEKKLSIVNVDHKVSLDKFIPTNLSSGNGIRINVSCHELDTIPTGFNIAIRPAFSYNLNGDVKKFYESETVTIAKNLNERGISVRFPFCSRIAIEDTVTNFPIFASDGSATANTVSECFEQFCKKWQEKGDDRLISYSVKINYQTKSIIFSFAGHVDDFISFYKTPQKNFPDAEDDVINWIEGAYSFLNKFPSANQSPKLSHLLSKNGILSFERKFVSADYIEEMRKDEKGIYAVLKMKSDEGRFIQDNGIWIALVHEVIDSKCSQCKKEYMYCDCIKFVNPSVAEIMSDIKMIGWVWTNRSAVIGQGQFGSESTSVRADTKYY